MAASITLASSGNWTDFSAAADKDISPAAAIPVGHRAIFIIGSTVDGGVSPGAGNYGGIDALTDSVGNVWTRDGFGPVDAVDSGTTVEIWSTVVTVQIPNSAYTIHVTPDSRGLSTNWFLADLDPGGEPTWLEQSERQAHSGFNMNMPTGTTMVVKSLNQLIIGVVSVGTASGVFTVPGPWTILGQYSGLGSGSAKATAVVYQFTAGAAPTTYGVTVVTTSNASTGMGCIVSYGIGSRSVDRADLTQHPKPILRTS